MLSAEKLSHKWFWEGHGFSRAAKSPKKLRALAPEGNRVYSPASFVRQLLSTQNLSDNGLVEGHGFSRAVNAKNHAGFSP